MSPRIRLEIDELVLHGFPARERHRILAATEAELARLLERDGAPRSWSVPLDAPQVDAGQFERGPRAGAESTGAAIARSILEAGER